MSKVLVISTSLRAHSNSDVLADEFARGAREACHEAEKITLRDKQMAFCRGCLTCGKLGRCVIQDDATAIAAAMHDADVICFATPIYYYEMSGQMKTLLDRSNSLFYSDYHFHDIYLLTTAAEDAPSVPERAESGLGGWVACYAHAHLAGTVFAGGVRDGGEIAGHEALARAYEMGKQV